MLSRLMGCLRLTLSSCQCCGSSPGMFRRDSKAPLILLMKHSATSNARALENAFFGTRSYSSPKNCPIATASVSNSPVFNSITGFIQLSDTFTSNIIKLHKYNRFFPSDTGFLHVIRIMHNFAPFRSCVHEQQSN